MDHKDPHPRKYFFQRIAVFFSERSRQGDSMCECFEPTYNDYEFGYGLGVLGHLMNEDEHIGYTLFRDVPIERFALLGRVSALTDGLGTEINRASQKPFEEIADFQITWTDADDFRVGYLKGLNDIRASLLELYKKISNPNRASTDYAYDEIEAWAKKWQTSQQAFDFSRAPVFAISGTFDEVKILSRVRAIFLFDGAPSDREAWLEIDMLESNPVKVLVAELWSKLASKDFGIGFSRGSQSVRPSSLEQELYSFGVDNLCDKHWEELVELNSEFLQRAGLAVEVI